MGWFSYKASGDLVLSATAIGVTVAYLSYWRIGGLVSSNTLVDKETKETARRQ